MRVTSYAEFVWDIGKLKYFYVYPRDLDLVININCDFIIIII